MRAWFLDSELSTCLILLNNDIFSHMSNIDKFDKLLILY